MGHPASGAAVAFGATVVGVLLAASLAAVGWLWRKAAAADVRLLAEQINNVATAVRENAAHIGGQDVAIRGLERHITRVEAELDLHKARTRRAPHRQGDPPGSDYTENGDVD